jgi:multicomponent K+:H+ antiporter subunit A
MRLMFPVIGGAAIFPLLRGHGLPGGGIAAGVTIVTAFILQYMAHGMTWVEARLHVMPVRWMGFGFPLAGCMGVAACVLRCPFLTSYFLLCLCRAAAGGCPWRAPSVSTLASCRSWSVPRC